jgi:hypothetical protein
MTTSVGFGWGNTLESAASISSYSEYLATSIRNGMAVYDDRNHKVGTVSKVYPPTKGREFYIKVDTGLFGGSVCLSGRYLTTWNNQVGVGLRRNQIKRMGWTMCPAMIRES